MSKFTDGIQNAVRKVEDFNSTPEGSVVMGGVSNILNLGLAALIVKKLFPAKATFGGAICAGMISVASTAAVGHASVLRERFRNAYETDNTSNNLRASVERMRCRIIKLEAELADKSDEATCAAVYRVRIDELKRQVAELQKENKKLSGKFANVQSILRDDLPEPPAEILAIV